MSWTELKARNPWVQLPPASPYVLEQDRSAISAINVKHNARRTEVRTEVLPEPFIGMLEAPIWLLNLNPGFELNDLTYSERVKSEQRQSIGLNAHRFWMLSEDNRDTGAFRWWDKKFASLIRLYGRERVAGSFFCAELFPYHSERFHHGHKSPSQEYTFEVVREGCKMGKAFVFMRAQKAWLEAVPELERCRTTVLRNKRNPTISFGNLVDTSIITDILGPAG